MSSSTSWQVAAGIAAVGAAAALWHRRSVAGAAAGRQAPAAAQAGAAGASHKVFTNSEFPTDEEGRPHHLQVPPGGLAPRVLTVGDHGRGSRLAAMLHDVTHYTSSRGMSTWTGIFEGVRVSIMAIGMGVPMADFAIREGRAIVDGPMAWLRLGTCGGLSDAPPGTIVVPSQGSVLVLRDPDGCRSGRPAEAYRVSNPVLPDPELSALFIQMLEQELDGKVPVDPAVKYGVQAGMDATADSFYSSQGRASPGDPFKDLNKGLLDRLLARYPKLCSMQMETFHLIDLAERTQAGPVSQRVRASGGAIVLTNRFIQNVAGAEDVRALESMGGRAALKALARCPLE